MNKETCDETCSRICPVRDERSEESAEHEHFWSISTCLGCSKETSPQELLQAERTRIIKALEGLKLTDEIEFEGVMIADIPPDLLKNLEATKSGFNSALDQAIKAVGESSDRKEEE